MPKFTYPSLLIFCLSILSFAPAYGAQAVRLDCLGRKNVLVSFFKYHLTTMKWGKHFQIAAGKHKYKTKSGAHYETIAFRNGDDLIYFPVKAKFWLFYANSEKPQRCRVEDSYTYPIVDLPHYDPKSDTLS